MHIDKFALSVTRMYDKIESLTSALTDLRHFIETHVSERDYVGLGYTSRDKFVDDVVDAVVYLHLRNEKIKSKINCSDDGETFNSFASRRVVNINQYKCKNCGTVNNFCTTIHENLSNFNEDDHDGDDDSKNSDDDDSDDDSEDDTKNRSQVRRNAILFISKWTIFKLVTELILWARCWFWGYCEKPWYILWNAKNKILNTGK
ncbi:ORF31 [Spodoptera eridania nucleopolyhedrovirus]|uniref:ORF31 n=1 Tax=Spodoptera eridania nucleopolyhedrovirus TaxID=2315721 RepID=A0A346TPW9_9ABAC|nr:ORF31 [Spodoptera eridania nucleopolyhedrovirus]AXU41629.1 ORF31 [Spodoptera eridania nucleopolyhedrovirus]